VKIWPALALSLVLGLAGGITISMPHVSASGASQPMPNRAPALINTCLITNDVNQLAAFYAQALQIEPHKVSDDYVEFRTSAGVLALFSDAAQEKYIAGSATPGQNRSVILEFRVADVDAEYARLHDLVKIWVKGPTTQPWGTRSIYFRDPDGNLVDYFVPSASRQ
jgi:catechol 2,3-dioxygenase-like lactoylglutathione lyase family enzyme